MTDKRERESAEKFAIEETCKAHKEHYEKRGDYSKTGEQIEREVKEMARDVERKKDHSIYKD